MSRKGENIFRRRDGRWEARYIHHYENGRPKYHYLYASSYAEAKAKKQYALSMLGADEIALPSNSFEKVARQWLSDVRVSVKESTYTRYHRTVEKYLLPCFSSLDVSELDHFRVNSFTEHLLCGGGIRMQGMSPKSVADILCVLKAIICFGECNGLVFGNTAGIRFPQRAQRSVKIIDKNARTRLERALMDAEDPTGIGVLFALFAGLRIGEVCGLRWSDVDFRRRTVTVSRTVERIANLDPDDMHKTKLIVSEPKTESSMRIIPLPKFLIEQLKRAKPDADDEHFILSNSLRPTEPSSFYGRYQTLMRRHGIEGYSFHALRHTFATRCVEKGFDTKSLSEILGHSSISTTLTFYVHPTLEQKRVQMERLTPGR